MTKVIVLTNWAKPAQTIMKLPVPPWLARCLGSLILYHKLLQGINLSDQVNGIHTPYVSISKVF